MQEFSIKETEAMLLEEIAQVLTNGEAGTAHRHSNTRIDPIWNPSQDDDLGPEPEEESDAYGTSYISVTGHCEAVRNALHPSENTRSEADKILGYVHTWSALGISPLPSLRPGTTLVSPFGKRPTPVRTPDEAPALERKGFPHPMRRIRKCMKGLC